MMTHPSKRGFNLDNVPSDWMFWQWLGIKQIKDILFTGLISKDEIRNAEHFKALLTTALRRVNELKTPALEEECAALAKEFYSRNIGAFYGYDKALDFLQVSAVVNFYLGNYRDAARYAGMLADIIFLDHNEITADYFTMPFDLMAAEAYEKCGSVARAAYHYNQSSNDRYCTQRNLEAVATAVFKIPATEVENDAAEREMMRPRF